MENKENNSAVEKVETISESPKSTVSKTTTKKTTTAKKPVKQTKTRKTAVSKKGSSSKKSPVNKTKREQERVKKAEAREERKAERMRLKEERRMAKLEAAENRKSARAEKREAAAARRLAKKEERIARRDMLKNESREERRARIAAERAEKIQLRKEKAELRAELISEKRENRKILRRQKRELRAQDRREKRARGIGGWLAAVISLGCATLLLATLYTFNMLYMSGGNELLSAMMQSYYYNLSGAVDNIDVNLGKLAVSQSPAQQQKLLTDIIVQSELAEAQLQSLPLEDASKYSTSKFINQLGDFSKSLSYKLADGGTITDVDRETINELYRRNSNLQQTLVKINEDMGKNFDFLTLLKPEENNAVVAGMNELENSSAEYPKMIYDGPFSDGNERSEAKGLNESEVKKSEALKNFKALFADYAIMEASVVNESNGEIETYNIEAMTESGSPIYAQMTKRGGRLILFNCYEPCETEKFTLDECREIAESFVKKAGFEDMKPVWETSSRAVAQFNFAYDLEGVTVYSDLVKVNVCMERGLVSAVEANTYYLNHDEERTLGDAKISREEAERLVGGTIDVASVRLALVPAGKEEKLAYEVFGTESGSQYFVYIDAATGKEIEIFKVIESTEGTLII